MHHVHRIAGSAARDSWQAGNDVEGTGQGNDDRMGRSNGQRGRRPLVLVACLPLVLLSTPEAVKAQQGIEAISLIEGMTTGGAGGHDHTGAEGGSGGSIDGDAVGEVGGSGQGIAGGGGGGPGADGGSGGGGSSGGAGGANGTFADPIGEDGGIGEEAVNNTAGGGGGGGGGHGYVGTELPDATDITGGAGGQGANEEFNFGYDYENFGGGGGGAGGYGAIVTDGGTQEIASDQTIAGGRGGDGGERSWLADSAGGSGGDGGIGLVLQGTSLTNRGDVLGGDGGSVSSGVQGTGGSGGHGMAFFGTSLENTASARIVGGSGQYGKAGGSGGTGLIFVGEELVNAGTILGGNGDYGSLGSPTNSGDGGHGIAFTGHRLVNSGTIRAGDGGNIDGAGGTGVRAPAGNVHLINAGTIEGGLDGQGNRVAAVEFLQGGNTVEIHPGAVFAGDVRAGGENNRLVLGGTGSDTFDAADIDTAFSGFQHFAKAGASEWTLDGPGSKDWTIHAGRLILTDEQTGDFILMSGATLDAAVPGLVVADGSRLGGTGEVRGDVTVGNEGVISPGNSIGTLTVDGDLLLEGGARYLAELNENDSDRLVVTGTATVEDGAIIQLTPDDGVDANALFSDGSTYTLFDAGTLVVNGEPELRNDFAYLDFRFAPSGNAFNVISQLSSSAGGSFCLSGMSANQCTTGDAAFSLGEGNGVYDRLLNMSAAQSEAALDRLSGEIHASLQGVLIEDGHLVRDVANSRLRRAAGGNAPSLDDEAVRDETSHWFRVLGAWGHQDGDGNASGVERELQGMLIGSDTALGGSAHGGVMAGYSRSDVTARDDRGSANVDSYHLGAYVMTPLGAGHVEFRGGAFYGHHEIDSARHALGQSLEDERRAQTLHGYVEVATRLNRGSVTLEPFANLAQVHHRASGGQESGGEAALHSASERYATTFTTLGVRPEATFAAGETAVSLYGSIGWRHAFDDTVPEREQRLQGGDEFRIAGTPMARNGVVMEAGSEVMLGENAALGFSYAGRFGDGSEDHGARASLEWRF